VVMDRRPWTYSEASAFRMLGRPTVTKADVRMDGCDATGVRERVLSRRAFPEAWNRARKGKLGSVVGVEDGGRRADRAEQG
jgi:ribosomal protein RSM22 (predicted rRNA methylase)